MSDWWRRRRAWPFNFEVRISGLFGGEPFSLRVTPEGVRTKGLERARRGLRLMPAEEREPLVDVVEEEKEVMVIAELPGVEKEKIDVRATETTLAISAESPYGKYRKELDLPAQVDPKSARASYKNGVLEVLLSKIAGKREGERIKIE